MAGLTRGMHVERVMAELVTDRFTVGVFADAAAAEKGIDALTRHGFAPQALSVIAKVSPEVDAVAQRLFGTTPPAIEVKNLGPTVMQGSLVEVLNANAKDLLALGLAAAVQHAGFQPHDGVIFERLVGRGGVLVGIASEGRASDAIATLHAYGAGNAAIGAWSGRV